MTDPPDATAWIPEKVMLELCDLSRAALRSWIKSGLGFEMAIRRAAYGIDEVITLLIFSSARKHLAPRELIAVWDHLESRGRATEIVKSARGLKSDDRFDLVLDLKYSTLDVALDDRELVAALRSDEPRPMVVIDLAEKMRRVVTSFGVKANTMPRPSRRKPGRPASPARYVKLVGGEK